MHSEWLGGQSSPCATNKNSGAKATVATHRLPESVRLERWDFCQSCENNRQGMCLKCQHCSGKLIEQKIKAVFEHCPLQPPKWKAWIEPHSVDLRASGT